VVLWTLLAIVAVFALAFLLLGRTRGIAGGRLGRIARISRLSARLSASWFGSRVRRLFAGKAKRKQLDAEGRKAAAALVTQEMGQMKGALMKLGQMMSFVSDDIPEEYRAALASLQHSAPAMPFALLRDVAERELGKPLERAFARFDETPLASASIGQVHRATLPDGTDVVVKIQYPGVADAIRADLANVGMLYQMMAMFYPALDPKPVVDELRERIVEELDYELEAKAQRTFCEIYAGHPFIVVPRVIDSHSTKLVLTSERIVGRRFAEILDDPPETRARYAEILYRFVFGSIINHGVFNGDPHPGNYLFTADGKIAFLDYGCIKWFRDPMMSDWLNLVRAHLGGDKTKFREQAVKLSFLKADSPITAETLYAYFAYFYEPFETQGEFEFSRDYNARSFRMVFAPQGEFAGLSKKLNMPRDFVFVNRIQWGVWSILAQLGARATWHTIHREYLFGDPPSTELGRLDAAWAAKADRSRRAQPSPAPSAVA
jgi:predicted unusual protein kinase regulating ubiquinone biosynthesis (AarF/ABC1/UbiB family)